MPFVIGAIGGALGIGAASGLAGFAAGAAFASTFVGGVLVNLAASVALSALSAAIAGKPKAPPPVGLRTKHVMTGGVNPEAIILGRYATSGAFACPPLSHTGSGRLPNGYLTYVIELAGSPGHQLETLILNGEEVEIIDPAPEGDETRIFGNKIGGHFEGKAWIRYYDGAQTAADPFLLDRFPAPHVRPWSADMVGAGICYAVVTFYYDRELFQGWPQCRFVLTGCPLYDPRADSTAGGTGAQRWNDPATWAPSHNPAVQVYNVLRGVSLPGGWVWGGGISADDLPYAVWAEAMDRCDALVDDGDGGTEAAYRAGFEILADDEPFEVIDELLRGCAGAVAESGGVWSIRVGGPALPVLFITDDDILGDAPEEFTPFPALDEVYNGISGTYIDPETLWESRDAAPIYNAAWEAEDGDRRLMATVQLAAVPYPVQVTRLMTALIADHRRMVRHVITLPSDAFAIEALDVIAWTSAANGYDAKSFEVMEVRRDLRAGRVQVALREVDPDDYDVPAGLTRPTPPDLRPLRADVQGVPGWDAEGVEILDATGAARRPGILVTWTASEIADARGVRVAIRRAVDAGEGDEKPVQAVSAGGAVFEVLPGVAYQARARLVADRPTEWTEWESVTAPDVRLSMADLADSVADQMAETAELAGVKPVTSLPAAGEKPDQIVMLVPDGILYRWDALAEEWTRSLFAGIKPGDVDVASFAAGIEPVTIHSGGSLPTVKGTEALTWNGKLYRWNGTAYVASVAAVDVTGTLTNAQLADLDAAKLTGTLSPDRIGTGALLSAKLADNAVTVAKIADAAITAGKIAAGAVSLTKFASGIEPVTVHTGGSLPGTKSTEALTWNGKLYRWNGTAYVASVPAADVTGTLTNAQLADLDAAKLTGTISPDRIGTGALLSAKLADNAVTVAKIADAAITAGKIAAGAVSLTKFASGIEPVTVHTGGSLPTVKGTEALTWNGKLYRWSGSAYVASVPAVDVTGTLTNAQIAALDAAKLTGTLSPDRIGTGALLSAKLADNAVTTAKIAALAVDGAKLASGSVTTAKVAAGAITAAEIGAGAITTAKLAAGAVTANEIAAGTITATQIASNAVTTIKLDAGAVTTAKVAAGAITAGEIASNAVTAVKISAGAVEAAKIAAGAVTADKIAANAIVAGKIAAGAVSADQIAALAITASKLAITDSANLYPDFNMVDPAFYTSPDGLTLTTAVNTSATDLGDNWAQINVNAADQTLRSFYFPVEALTDYLASAVASSATAGTVTSSVYLDLATVDGSGNPVFSRAILISQRINTFSVVAERVEITTSATERRARFRLVRSGGGTVQARGGGFKLQKRMGGSLIVDGAISAAKIAAGAVEAGAIAAGAVTTAKLAAGAVTANEIAAGTITATQIASNAITTIKLEAGAVTTAKIAALAVTAGEIAANAITAVKINAGAVETTKLAANAVTADKIEANAITAGKIAAGVISATELGANAVTAVKLAAGAVEAAKIAAGAVEAVAIGAGAVTTAKLAAGAVTADKIEAGTITAAQIASNAITTIKLEAGAVTTGKIAALAVTANEIAANAITAVKINAGAVETTKLAANAVTADKIAANAIVAGKIAAGAVSADQIAALAITASKLAITDSANLYPDFNMVDPAFYTSPDGITLTTVANTSSADLGNYWAQIAANAADRTLRSFYFPIEGMTDYLVSAVASSGASGTVTSTVYLDLATTDGSGNPAFSRAITVSQRVNSFSTVAERVEITTSTAERWARFRIVRSGGGTVPGRGGGFKLQKRAAGSLIVDGAITAAKVAAGAITADKIAAGAIVTSKLAAGSITADKFAAGQIIAGDLVVTGSITRLQLESGTLSDRVVISQSPAFFSGTGGTYAPVRDAPGNGPFDNTNSTLVDTISVVLSATDNNVPERIFLEFSTVNYIAFNWTTPGTGNTYQSWYVVVNVKVNGTTIDTVEVPLKVGGWNWASLTEFVHIRGADVSQSIQLLKGVDFDPGDTLSFEFRAWRYRQASNETLTLDISETRATLTEFYR